MADNNSKEHVYRLSSVDQASTRVYLRYCLCFPCSSSPGDIDSIKNRLNATVKRAITQLPILAGRVRPTSESNAQTGRLEVVVTLDNVHQFQVTTTYLGQEDIGNIYNNLERARMPPATFINEKLTPLPDIPDPQTAAVFAVKANFVPGGVIVALYLHHAVADVVGLGTVVTHVSSDLPSCKLTCDELNEDAVEQSRLRDRLSGSRGVKADIGITSHRHTGSESVDSTLNALTLRPSQASSRVLSFNLKFLDQIKDIATERFHVMHNDRSTQLSSFDVLAAVLWKGVSRARVSAKDSLQDDLQYDTSLAIGVDIRTLIEPPLDDSYLGNAEISAIATSSAVKLILPFDVGTLARTARLIHDEIGMLTEARVRSAIAGINVSADVQSSPITKINPEKDLVITSWADLPLEQAHLGLGLGAPGWVRKVGRAQTADGCIIHPVRWEEGLCEVTVQLDEEIIKALVEDENFMAFVVHVV